MSSLQYTAHNVDTFVDGHSRVKQGEAMLIRDAAPGQFPFKLYGKDDEGNEGAFVGGLATMIYHASKEFEIRPYSEYREIIGTQAGQLILMEFLFPETPFNPQSGSGYKKLSARELPTTYVLTIDYPNNEMFGIRNRFKKITLDKQTFIPVSYYHKFDTPDGQKQVNIRELTIIGVNDPSIQFPVIDTAAVGYSQIDKLKKIYTSTYQELMNTQFIDITLKNIDGTTAQLAKKKGKVILLAFWETWCSPCLESIPKIKQLVNKYSPDAFEVWGIASDEKTFPKVPAVVKRTGINYPVYYGTEQTKKDYRVTGVPEYVIIDQSGKIVFINAGFSDEIEKILDTLLK